MNTWHKPNIIRGAVDAYAKFGISTDPAFDNTAAINAAFLYAANEKRRLTMPDGIYRTVGSLALGAAVIDAPNGAIIDHRPATDTIDALVVTGADAGRTIVAGLNFYGMQAGQLYGRDLIRLSKGDYITLRDVYLNTPKRDAFQARPTASGHWIENLLLENVKIQLPQMVSAISVAGINASQTSFTVTSAATFPDYVPFNIIVDNEVMTVGAINKGTNTLSSITRGVEKTVAATHNLAADVQVRQGRDGFHYEVQGAMSGSYKPFINQVTMINCETRSVVRHALMLENTITGATTAQKLSCFEIINCEFGVAKGADAIVRLKGNGAGSNIPSIENISIRGTAIENTEAERTGAGVLITGRMSGLFNLDNSVIFGTAAKVVGFEQFPHYYIRDIGSTAYVPLFSSHGGIFKKARTTGTLAPNNGINSTADIHALVDAEVIEGYVQEQFGNTAFFNKFTTNGKSVPVSAATNVTVSVANAQSLGISTACTTSGNITVTIDTVPFVIPLDSAEHYSPDLVATAIAAFTFTGIRALKSGTQTIIFTRADNVAPAVSATYGTTGVTGSVDTTAKALRITNTHASTTTSFDVLMDKAVKDQPS